ncbi:MAG: hypothetical protein ACKO9B_08345 [Planctomycetota bacterium]
MKSMWVLTIMVSCLSALSSAAGAQELAVRSWVGDAGHFLLNSPQRIFANNPDGKAFVVTVHNHLWKAGPGFGGGCSFVVRGPGGDQVATGGIAAGETPATVMVPAGPKGVYAIEIRSGGYSLTWVESSLAQMVAEAEPFDAVGSHPFQLHAMVPRRWYFHVPAGTRKFQVRHVVQVGQTHREDYGLFVVNPRGQRVDALFGGKSLDMSPTTGVQPGFTLPNSPVPVTRTIEVDPGTAGRFWSLWIVGGDSHNYSDLMLQLDGVPASFASSPDQWFDPRTGQGPPPLAYDESVIRRPDVVDANGNAHEPYPRYLCSPAPFLGDEDYNGWRGPHTVWFANPENRKIEFGVQTYLEEPGERDVPVAVTVMSPKEKLLPKESLKLGKSLEIPAAGAGAYRVDCDGRRWFPWTYPVPPIVIQGRPTGAGGTRFALETGLARQWYFLVPRETKEFKVAVNVLDANQVLRVEVHAPDRIVEELAVRGGAQREITVAVEPRLAGRIWFLRTEIGSATRFVSDKDHPRQTNIEADIELLGVPGYLAPTWEQWFDPQRPADSAKARGGR